MAIGLICAIPQQLALSTDSACEQAAHSHFDTGTIDGHDAVPADSAKGKDKAAIGTTLSCDIVSAVPQLASPAPGGGVDPLLDIGESSPPNKSSSMPQACSRRDWRSRVNPARLMTSGASGEIVYRTVLSGNKYLNCATSRDRWVSRGRHCGLATGKGVAAVSARPLGSHHDICSHP